MPCELVSAHVHTWFVLIGLTHLATFIQAASPSAHADLWAGRVSCNSCAVGPTYCLFILFYAFFSKVIFSMCALKKNIGFLMRSDFWCCSFGCERCTAFFVLTTSRPWFGRTEMRASVFSCIPWRWENSQEQAWAVAPTGTPRYILQSIQFINEWFPLSLGFITFYKVWWIQWCRAAVPT